MHKTVLLLLALGTGAPFRADAAVSTISQAPAPLLFRVGKWLVAALTGYFFDKTIDRALGLDYERQLAEAERRLRVDLSREGANREALEVELGLTQSQLKTVRSLLAGAPSKADLERLRSRVDEDLSRILTVLSQQDERLVNQGNKVMALESEIAGLRARLDSIQTQRREIIGSRNPRLRVGPYATLAGGAVSLESKARQSNVPIEASDSRIAALARLGWRSSAAVSIGLEATFWMRSTKIVDQPGGGTVSLSTPFRTYGGTLTLPLYLTPGPSFPLFIYGGPGIAMEFDHSGTFDGSGNLLAPATKRGAGLAYVAGAGVEIQTTPTNSLILFARYSSSRYSISLPRGQGTITEGLERRMIFVGAGLSLNHAKYMYRQ